MLPARPTILRLMYLVLMVALNAALIRDWYACFSRPGSYIPAFTALEFGMVNILGFALDRAVFADTRRRAFARGFFLIGIIPLAIVATYCSLHTRKEVFESLWPLLFLKDWSRFLVSWLWLPRRWLIGSFGPAIYLTAMTTVFAAPQVLLASVGGSANFLAWRTYDRFRAQTARPALNGSFLPEVD